MRAHFTSLQRVLARATLRVGVVSACATTVAACARGADLDIALSGGSSSKNHGGVAGWAGGAGRGRN